MRYSVCHSQNKPQINLTIFLSKTTFIDARSSYVKEESRLSHIPSTQRTVYRKVNPAHTLWNAPSRNGTYPGSSKKAVLGPSTSSIGEESASQLLGVEAISCQSSTPLFQISYLRTEQIREPPLKWLHWFCWTGEIQKASKNGRECVLGDIRLQPVEGHSFGGPFIWRAIHLSCAWRSTSFAVDARA